MDVDEWSHELLASAVVALAKYEDHLRNDIPLGASKDLAKAMRRLKNAIPDELLEIIRAQSMPR